MSKPVAIVTRKWPESCEERLKELFDVTLNANDKPFTEEQLKTAMQNCDVLMPTVTDKINANVLSVENRRVNMIGNFGVGFNHIDIEVAKKNGITVSNTPAVLTDCTADIGMSLLLMVARRVGEGERELRANKWTGWRPTHLLGTKVTGKTLGIIGFGRIGQALAKRAKFGFDMKIVFWDPFDISVDVVNKFEATKLDTIEDVCKEGDFISVNCPATKETFHLIDEKKLKLMKNTAFLINTARGDIIDETALVQALKNKTIAGVGLDVFETEPNLPEELKTLENVVSFPHLGSASIETRIAMGNTAIENSLAFFEKRDLPNKVV
ncbi:MAG: D-glycerate dehydrogenase [Gammaproteobacteria bacterium]|nr:D-glycerate dehydrogenase [Gammaproteobacteria bacterium]|tara:strand:+ start:29029 stop:30000 length:972 start_codon:yes stop_codon:yes gene_type:complete